MARKSKILGLDQIAKTKHRIMEFDGEWRKAFGRPAINGSWLIWGNSNQGKTRFALQLCKYLTNFGRVAYDSLEEGNSRSMQMAVEQLNMGEVSGKFVLLDRMKLSELEEYMAKEKSPRFIVIDSLQYTRMTYNRYVELKEKYTNKLLILISHAEGKEPKGSAAKAVRYDVDCKIYDEGFRAMVAGRFQEGAAEPFTIWEEGAALYWGNKENSTENE